MLSSRVISLGLSLGAKNLPVKRGSKIAERTDVLEGHFSGSFSASHSYDVFEKYVEIVAKTIRFFPMFSWRRVVT